MFAARVAGPTNFNVLGVWAQADPNYSAAILQGLTLYRDFLRSGPSIVLGDFNSSVAWDEKHGRTDHRDLEERLRQEFGLVSAYHAATAEPPGTESRPTHFWRWHEASPYHLDYCYIPESWMLGLRAVTVGTYREWADASDHRPLVIEVDASASFAQAAV